MAIFQTKLVTDEQATPQAFTAGAVVSVIAEFTISTGMEVKSTDIIEFAVLPADHRIVDAILMPSGDFDGKTADIGIMTGTVGDKDSVTRTSGNQIFATQALTGFARLSKAEGILLATSDKDRSIGVKFSGDLTGAGQVLRVQFLLTQ